jgi:hypothetical protein
MIISFEKRMEPLISIPLERTLVGLAMTKEKDQRAEGLAMVKIGNHAMIFNRGFLTPPRGSSTFAA